MDAIIERWKKLFQDNFDISNEDFEKILEEIKSKKEEVDLTDSLSKSKVAYHEHDGFSEHPVAVKNHSEYFSKIAVPTPVKEVPTTLEDNQLVTPKAKSMKFEIGRALKDAGINPAGIKISVSERHKYPQAVGNKVLMPAQLVDDIELFVGNIAHEAKHVEMTLSGEAFDMTENEIEVEARKAQLKAVKGIYGPTKVYAHTVGWSGLPNVLSEGEGPEELISYIKKEGLLAGKYAGKGTKEFDKKFGRKPAVYTYAFNQWAKFPVSWLSKDRIKTVVFVFLTPSLQKNTEVHDDDITHGRLWKTGKSQRNQWLATRRQYGMNISHIKRAEFATLVDIPPSNIVAGQDLLERVPEFEESSYRTEDIENILTLILLERQQANILKATTAIHVWNPNEESLEEESIEKSDIPLSVKALIQDNEGRILALRDNEIKFWDLPGGHVDSDDRDFLDSLRREIREETGLEVISCSPFDLTGRVQIGRDQCSVLFYKVLASGEIELSPEHDKYKWVNHEDLKDMPFGQFSGVLEQAFIRKQYAMPCAVGEHQHSGMTYCHPVSQHHRFEHRKVGAGTEKYEEYTVPIPGSKEAFEERIERYKRIQEDLKEQAEERGEEFTPSMSSEEEARRDESEAASYAELSPVTVGAISRIHHIDDKSLVENLQKIYGKQALEQQIVTEEAFTAEGHPLKYKVLKLTPSQVYIAHEIAAQIRRRALSRSEVAKPLRMRPILAMVEKMIPTLVDMPREYAKYIDFGGGAYFKFIQQHPEFNTKEFEEYVVVHNLADRDSGELSDIASGEIKRLAGEYKIIDLSKAKKYLGPGEIPPENIQEQRGPRGGRFYEAPLATSEELSKVTEFLREFKGAAEREFGSFDTPASRMLTDYVTIAFGGKVPESNLDLHLSYAIKPLEEGTGEPRVRLRTKDDWERYFENLRVDIRTIPEYTVWKQLKSAKTYSDKVIALDGFMHLEHQGGSYLMYIPGAPTSEEDYSSAAHLLNYLAGNEEKLENSFIEIRKQNRLEKSKIYVESPREAPEESFDDGEDIEEDVEKEEITSERFPEAPKSIVLEPEMAIKSNSFPDSYSSDVYSWIDLQLAGVDIGGKQPYGSKIIGKNIEQHLYSTLQDAIRDYLESLTGRETQFEAIEGIRSIISKWAEENLPIADKAFEDLFRRGFAAGVVAEGGKLGTSDKLAMEILQDGKYRIGNRIKLFGDSTIKDFSNIITQSYTPEGRFELKSLVEKMEKAVPAKRYELERVARTETAFVSSTGRLWAWENDPDRDYYFYRWSTVPDNRQKAISRLRASYGNLSFPEIKYLFFHQEQYVPETKRFENDSFNQRCTITRIPSDEKVTGNRFEGQEHLFRETTDITF